MYKKLLDKIKTIRAKYNSKGSFNNNKDLDVTISYEDNKKPEIKDSFNGNDGCTMNIKF